MKFERQYRKTAITKAYDLLELKANDRVDADGDYLDDDGNKLTKTLVAGRFELSPTVWKVCNQPQETIKNCRNEVIENGFICVGAVGERWCVRRDIFLATYEEIENGNKNTTNR